MVFATQAEAQRFLDACHFVPALTRRHRVVRTTYWPVEADHPRPCWTVVLLG